jgi:hypothetical protein
LKFDKRRTFIGREHLDPGTPNSEWRRAIDAQMRKFGFARNSRHLVRQGSLCVLVNCKEFIM